MRLSLFWKISIPILVLFGISSLLLTWYSTDATQEYAIQRLKDTLQADAQLFAAQLNSSGDQKDIQALVNRFSSELGNRVTVISANGTVLADSEADITRMDNHANRPEVQDALSTGIGTQVRYSNTLGMDLLYVDRKSVV